MASELVPRRHGVQGGGRWQGLRVLGMVVDATLLLGLPGMCPVPVRGHRLVVPDGGGLRVAQVPRLARVVGGVDEQRLCGEGFQVPGLVMLLVLGSENKGAQACQGAGHVQSRGRERGALLVIS